VKELWFRGLDQKMLRADVALKNVYDVIVEEYKFKTGEDYTNEEFNRNIISFKLFYDTLFFQLPKAIIMAKLSIENDTNVLYTNLNDVKFIIIEDNMKYVDHYFFPESQQVTLCFLVYCLGLTPYSKQIRPLLYSYNIETNNMNIIYNESNQNTDFYYPFLSINDIDSAAITYDKLRLVYNVSFIHKNEERGLYLTSINLKQFQSIFVPIKTTVIEPV